MLYTSFPLSLYKCACARSTRAFNLVYSLISQPFRSVVIVVFDEVVRYVSQKVIISGNRVEIWKYENPIRADVIDRAHGLPDVADSDSERSKLYTKQAAGLKTEHGEDCYKV